MHLNSGQCHGVGWGPGLLGSLVLTGFGVTRYLAPCLHQQDGPCPRTGTQIIIPFLGNEQSQVRSH